MLVGRAGELARLDRLLTEAGAGRSGALVVRGEAGIGKSALLDEAASAARARGMRVLRGVGIESEAELPFSGLHLLLHPYVDRFDALPGQQRAALQSVFGLVETPVVDRFMIGAAVLTLLSDLADERPLLCLLDDAQWLDRASSEVLFFAARRIYADPIAMIFAVRDTAERLPTPGLDVLQLDRLDRAAAMEVVDVRVPGLSAPVRDRLCDEAAGNPLALIELGGALRAGPAHPAHPVGPLRGSGGVQEAFRAQIGGLPPATRLLLVVAGADGTADLQLVLRAAETLGAGAGDLVPAEEAQLIVLTDHELRFRHPLIRSAAYHGAPYQQRVAVNAALAACLADLDRRAWHLAAAATRPDETVAAELEQSARRAQRRGGPVAVAAAYERAARLSTEPAGRARRVVSAARAAYDAGRHDWATRLAAEAAAGAEDAAVAAEATYIRAQVEYERTSPAADAALALDAAKLIAPTDPERAVSMLTEAVWAARDAGDHGLVRQSVELLETLTLRPGSSLAAVAEALLGYGELIEGRPQVAVDRMRVLVAVADARTVDELVDRVIAGFTALLVADDDGAIAVLEPLVADGRTLGVIGWLPYALEPLAIGRSLRGEFKAAVADVAEAVSLARDMGMDMQVTALQAISVWLSAVVGDEDRCRPLADGVLRRAELHPTNAALASWGLALADLAAGRPEPALDRLDAVCTGPARDDLLIRAVPDHVEAAVRSGRRDLAVSHLPRLERWAESTGAGFAIALTGRCHALLSKGAEADEHYRSALGHDRDGARPYDTARTRLLYGEWLRRRRRRSDAHAQLTRARETFARLGASPWRERAQRELEALGDKPVAQVHDVDLLKRLTPQELQVVRLAATGLSNREIGARLYLSPRTVTHHLYKAFPKLGVSKRIELTQLDL